MFTEKSEIDIKIDLYMQYKMQKEELERKMEELKLIFLEKGNYRNDFYSVQKRKGSKRYDTEDIKLVEEQFLKLEPKLNTMAIDAHISQYGSLPFGVMLKETADYVVVLVNKDKEQ